MAEITSVWAVVVGSAIWHPVQPGHLLDKDQVQYDRAPNGAIFNKYEPKAKPLPDYCHVTENGEISVSLACAKGAL